MIKDARQLISIAHGNVYAVMRADLPPGKKGGENDIVAVLAIRQTARALRAIKHRPTRCGLGRENAR
jgi:hypothetical protein